MSENNEAALKDRGIQPLDAVMVRLGLQNHDLVQASQEQLTHKMVAKGRKGRALSLNVQGKILRAVNAAQTVQIFSLNDLFLYKGH